MTGNDFNPRPLAGATFVVVNGVGSVVISIHAPLRGRLNGYDRLLYRITISIHAPLRGRLSRSLVRFSSCAFQSTPPCGGDPGDVKTFLDCPYFNPRPLAGATNFVGVAHHGLGISIHAPLRGRPRVPPFSTLKCGNRKPAWILALGHFSHIPTFFVCLGAYIFKYIRETMLCWK